MCGGRPGCSSLRPRRSRAWNRAEPARADLASALGECVMRCAPIVRPADPRELSTTVACAPGRTNTIRRPSKRRSSVRRVGRVVAQVAVLQPEQLAALHLDGHESSRPWRGRRARRAARTRSARRRRRPGPRRGTGRRRRRARSTPLRRAERPRPRAGARRAATTSPPRSVSSSRAALRVVVTADQYPFCSSNGRAGTSSPPYVSRSSSPLPKHTTSIGSSVGGVPHPRDRTGAEVALPVGVVVRADRDVRDGLVGPPAAAQVPGVLLEARERQQPGPGAVRRPAARLAQVVDARPEELPRDVVVVARPRSQSA